MSRSRTGRNNGHHHRGYRQQHNDAPHRTPPYPQGGTHQPHLTSRNTFNYERKRGSWQGVSLYAWMSESGHSRKPGFRYGPFSETEKPKWHQKSRDCYRPRPLSFRCSSGGLLADDARRFVAELSHASTHPGNRLARIDRPNLRRTRFRGPAPCRLERYRIACRCQTRKTRLARPRRYRSW
jgi:hypothetical protein